MDIAHLVKLSITLNTDRTHRPIPLRIGIDQQLELQEIQGPTTVNFEFETKKTSSLVLQISDKQDQEAVIIESVSFFGIEDPRFVWAGVYTPEYPEPWASQQRSKGVYLQPHLVNQDYLGWNGQWTLTFEVPVFTWIHKTQNLGWIYS
jgi:hypothetical protein